MREGWPALSSDGCVTVFGGIGRQENAPLRVPSGPGSVSAANVRHPLLSRDCKGAVAGFNTREPPRSVKHPPPAGRVRSTTSRKLCNFRWASARWLCSSIVRGKRRKQTPRKLCVSSSAQTTELMTLPILRNLTLTTKIRPIPRGEFHPTRLGTSPRSQVS